MPKSCLRKTVAAALAVFIAASGATHAYLERTPAALRELMVRRFGNDAAGHLADWEGAMQVGAGSDEVRKLGVINTAANRIPYLSDAQNWSMQDYWATPAEFISKNAGDCEDYAIAKYYALRTLGVAGDKLRLVYVRAFFEGQLVPHMVLAWYARGDAEPLLLDNIDTRLLSASQRPDLSPVFSFNDQGVWRTGRSVESDDRTPGPWRDLQRRVMREMAL